MKSYKRYFLEYYKGDPYTNPRMSNGKDVNRINNRKNTNTVNKEYKHKHPLINTVSTGKANNVKVAGQQLINILRLYGVQFVAGDTKVLGNSNVEVEMQNLNGVNIGYFRNRKS